MKASRFDWESKIQLGDAEVIEIYWWKNNINTITPMKRTSPDLVITSDASLIGYGCVCDGISAKGVWSESEKDQHINYLELKASFFSLKIFAKNCKKSHILLRLDNTTCVQLINNMGTCKSPKLLDLCINMFEWCREREIWLSATYIPSKINEADEPSRSGNIEKNDKEWQLNPSIFSYICEKLAYIPKIDLFASRLNTQTKVFVSYEPDPEATHVNAFTLDWGGLAFYAFPPFNLMLKVLEKIIIDQAEGIIVMPDWKSQPFYSLATKIAISPMITLSPRKDMLLCPGFPGREHRLKNLRLVFCKVSGRNWQMPGLHNKP